MFRFLPREAATRPEQVHEGNTNKTVYIKDQVGFLKINKRSKNQFILIQKKISELSQPCVHRCCTEMSVCHYNVLILTFEQYTGSFTNAVISFFPSR